MPTTSTKSLLKKLAAVRLLLCDVDGVLTNGSIFINQDSETKQFSIQDGLGLRLLQRSGVKIGWASNRPSPVTARRAAELKIDFLHQKDGNKVEAAEAILKEAGVTWAETCFVGDDLVDLGALRRAGVAVAVANGIAEARALADYVTRARGGHGAVREVVTLILKAQKKWSKLVREYSA
jgi:3-deoxy-D-manno-octulosonate 8-phosphate phosphatase (KDO 8-P phosphatase)